MNNTVLLIIVFSYLRKVLDTKNTNAALHQKLVAGLMLAIAFTVLSVSLPITRPYIKIASYALMLFMIFTVLIKKEFRAARLFVYALLPLAIIEMLGELVQWIDSSFYNNWNDYFDIAELFAVLWLVAMVIINSRQRKALQKEKEKLIEKEKEAKLAAEMKAVLETQVSQRTSELLGQKLELEKALHDLKSVQAQLIQSEKMASLGELTAGIAHEIQNPLNFVNNFSEVNKELLAEMNDAINKGDYEEAKALAVDISGNQDKINFHGKRADGIVKGMLQHSRTSSGQKELTDINTLADEYLRLSFHGLRAKEKTFNAKFETDFDTTIPKINIVPQDVGRVILNLINNAFYAVNERKKQSQLNAPNDSGKTYEPTVLVSTKKINSIILITIKDNGNGIPQSVVDKIFQPFFTTKPTGQGTGLGLSLSYDIVKAHGGDLTVETKENEGTTFTIQLPLA